MTTKHTIIKNYNNKENIPKLSMADVSDMAVAWARRLNRMLYQTWENDGKIVEGTSRIYSVREDFHQGAWMAVMAMYVHSPRLQSTLFFNFDVILPNKKVEEADPLILAIRALIIRKGFFTKVEEA